MCCLYGIMDIHHRIPGKQKAALLHSLATAAEERGTDASGYALNRSGRLAIYKAPIPGHCLRFRVPDDTAAVMGHARLTTQGNELLNRNNHPFRGKAGGTSFALAHNGILRNDYELQASLKLPKTRIETDSYVAVQLLEHQNALDFSSLKAMAEQVEGSFTFTVLDEADNLYFVKGDSPLCLYFIGDLGLYVYASTVEILFSGATCIGLSSESAEEVNIQAGEIVKLDRNGAISRTSFDTAKLAQNLWSFPQAYFLRESQPHSYLAELRDKAEWMGYPPEVVDYYRHRGYTPGEIEELLYCGETGKS